MKIGACTHFLGETKMMFIELYGLVRTSRTDMWVPSTPSTGHNWNVFAGQIEQKQRKAGLNVVHFKPLHPSWGVLICGFLWKNDTPNSNGFPQCSLFKWPFGDIHYFQSNPYATMIVLSQGLPAHCWHKDSRSAKTSGFIEISHHLWFRSCNSCPRLHPFSFPKKRWRHDPFLRSECAVAALVLSTEQGFGWAHIVRPGKAAASWVVVQNSMWGVLK